MDVENYYGTSLRDCILCERCCVSLYICNGFAVVQYGWSMSVRYCEYMCVCVCACAVVIDETFCVPCWILSRLTGLHILVHNLSLQCFDAVGWAAGRASGL